MASTITTRLDDTVVREIDKVAAVEAIERSAVIRKFLIRAVKDWKIQKSLEEYEKGRITMWQAAKKCGVSIWEMIDEAKARLIHVPYGSSELKEDIKGLQ
ncbi:UPF0175 family protein [Candidatus Woesearchaeota archaeon]|nr:UPF0175 family protein [Candidatus Woesearchaeota archaeon]